MAVGAFVMQTTLGHAEEASAGPILGVTARVICALEQSRLTRLGHDRWNRKPAHFSGRFVGMICPDVHGALRNIFLIQKTVLN